LVGVVFHTSCPAGYGLEPVGRRGKTPEEILRKIECTRTRVKFDYVGFGSKLWQRVKERGFNDNLRTLAQESGISVQVLEGYLQGAHEPSVAKAFSLARALEWSLDEMLAGMVSVEE